MKELVNDMKDLINSTNNIQELFEDTDDLIKWHLDHEFNFKDFTQALEVLSGNKTFVKIIVFSLRRGVDKEYFSSLEAEEIDMTFIRHLRLLTAKYYSQIESKVNTNINPNGWKTIKSRVIVEPVPQLEISIVRNDDKKFIIEDDIFSIIEFAQIFMDELLNLKAYVSKDDLEGWNEEVKELEEILGALKHQE